MYHHLVGLFHNLLLQSVLEVLFVLKISKSFFIPLAAATRHISPSFVSYIFSCFMWFNSASVVFDSMNGSHCTSDCARFMLLVLSCLLVSFVARDSPLSPGIPPSCPGPRAPPSWPVLDGLS